MEHIVDLGAGPESNRLVTLIAATKASAAAEQEAAGRRGWQRFLAKHRRASDEPLEGLNLRVANAESQVLPSDWEAVAEALACELAAESWRVLRVGLPAEHRHVFAADIRAHITQITSTAHAQLEDTTVHFENERGRPAGWIVVREHPELLARLKISDVRRYIEDRVNYWQSIANDPVFLTLEETDPDGRRTLIVQHQRSSLRARFIPTADGIGTIYSKPYGSGGVRSIDPQRPGDLDHEPVAGLGIGRRIYLEGARLLADQRWATTSLSSPHSKNLREHLHLSNPYLWQGPCTWCAAQGLDWKTTTAAVFNAHP